MKQYRTWMNASRLFPVFLIGLFTFPVCAAPSEQDEDPQVKADALYLDGYDLFQQGNYESAIRSFESALTIYEEIGDRGGKVRRSTALDLLTVS